MRCTEHIRIRIQRCARVLAIGALSAIALGSCGGATSAPAPAKGVNVKEVDGVIRSSQSQAQEIHLTSPAVSAGGKIDSHYRCRNAGPWLPLRWSSVPSGTAELVLYGGRVADGPEGSSVLRSAIIATGLDPQLRSLRVGSLPSHDGYVVRYRKQAACPERGSAGTLFFRLYALPPGERLDLTSANPQMLAVLSRRALGTGEIAADYGYRGQ